MTTWTLLLALLPTATVAFGIGYYEGAKGARDEAWAARNQLVDQHQHREAACQKWYESEQADRHQCDLDLVRCKDGCENYVREPRCPNEIVVGNPGGSHAGIMGVACPTGEVAMVHAIEMDSTHPLFKTKCAVKWFCAAPMEGM